MSKSKSSSKTSNLRFDQVNTEPIIPNNNTIDEDPELNTDAELSEAELGKKFLQKIANGSSINSILTFFSCSPVIMLLLSGNAFQIGGIFPCIILYILFIFATYLSLCMLLRMIIEKRSNSYYQMVVAFLSRKTRILFDVFYGLFYIGYLLINVIVVQRIVESFFEKEEKENKIIITSIALGVILILQIVIGLKRTIEYWRIFKFIQVIILIIGSLTFFIVTLVKVNKDNIKNEENIFFNKSTSYFLMFAMMNIFLFNQFNLFQEIQFLKGFSKKRGLSVLTNTLLLQFFAFVGLGIIGFISLRGLNTPLFFFFSPIKNLPDPFLLIMKIFFLFVFLTELSHTLVVLSDFIRYIISKNEIPFKFHLINIFFIALISNLIAYFLKNVVDCLLKIIISIIGGVCAGVIEYVVPGILYLTVENKMSKNNKLLTIVLMSWMMLLGLGVTVCGIIFSVNAGDNQ